jgi:DNA-binding NarL/FixJ family response regulator
MTQFVASRLEACCCSRLRRVGFAIPWAGQGSDTQIEPLTAREVDILRLVAGGYSNKEIARNLHLAEGTVKNYISELLVKLDSRDRTSAVLSAITRRLI